MKPYISVVIGFKDWGLKRLELAIQSIQDSFGAIPGEVILSDYGSETSEENQSLAEKLNISYVFTQTEGEWSRSRALNAGFAIASGDFLVSTDADMIFSPTAFEIIGKIAQSDPRSAFFLQCRDLPELMDDNWVDLNPGAWERMEKASRLRPRWGMGGMMAIHRDGFEQIRGFDERLVTYGGEDLDFAQRARRAGYRTHWIDHPEVRMYHMWHPPTAKIVSKTVEGTQAVEFNRSVVFNDKSFVRNYLEWRGKAKNVRPLVTVAISTRNRADLISETIQSILFQSVQDFEIVVVDDGGSDNLKSVLESFNDKRIRYFWIEHLGISGARNFALDNSRGVYTAVLDDDDLMHPERLRWHFESLIEGQSGNVGSFMNFNNETGETQLHVSMIPRRNTAVEKGSAPGHGTWLIKTDILKKFRYDESLTSGVDNNIMLRMLRAGVSLGHTGRPVTLRRMHDRQVTVTDNSNQINAARNSLSFFRWTMSPSSLEKLQSEKKAEGAYPKIDGREQMSSTVIPFLPDHLVHRNLILVDFKMNLNLDWEGEEKCYSVRIDGVGEKQLGFIEDATYADLVLARRKNLDFRVILQNGDSKHLNQRISWFDGLWDLVEETRLSEESWAVLVPESQTLNLDSWSVAVELPSRTLTWNLVFGNELEIKNLAFSVSGAIIIGPGFSGELK